MSYCRFSSDNWKSDVYVYEHFYGGFVCHIANRKRVHPSGSECPPLDFTTAPSFEHSYAAQLKWREEAELVPLNLPEVEDFSTGTAAEMAVRLLELRGMGYHIPQSALDALQEEA